ncbi:MAG TPA: hypothetical protein VN153_06560 [Tahibacter sp.]|nr:hypothetical protein [Tahibacter sp.]
MRRKISSRDARLENPVSREQPGIPGSPASSKRDRDASESGSPDKRSQDVAHECASVSHRRSVHGGSVIVSLIV